MIRIKNFPTLFYLFLLQKSMWDNYHNYRYISKRDISYAAFAEELNCSKQQIGKMMRFLESHSYLSPQKGFYIITEKLYAVTLPNTTMKTFINQGVVFSDYTLQIYYYLLCNYQIKYKSKPFLFSLDKFTTIEKDKTEIKKQLNLLYILGLIDYEFTTKEQVNDCNYILTKATRYINPPKGENTKQFLTFANEVKLRKSIK